MVSAASSPPEALKLLFRKVHTFKGGLNQYEMPETPAVLHRMEQGLSELAAGGSGFTEKQLRELLQGPSITKAIARDTAVLENSLGRSFFSDVRKVAVPVSCLKALKHTVSTLSKDQSLSHGMRSSLGHLEEDILRMQYVELKFLVAGYDRYVQQMADRMEKAVAPLVISGPDIYVDPDWIHPFMKSLVHIFRNALVHGIESPDERLQKNKSEEGLIHCRVDHTDKGYIHIHIEDDGRGLDKNALFDKLMESGHTPDMSPAEMTEQALFEKMLFVGVSTRRNADIYGGRGVGLGAVAGEVARLGGTITVKSTGMTGTAFSISLPSEEYMLL